MVANLRVAVAAAALLLSGALLTRAEDPKARLDNSSRHQEWLSLKVGARMLQTFVVFPEVSDPATAVIVIHENKGLTDWVKSAADQFAEKGYIALAPDLLSGMGPDKGGTDSFASQGDATKAIYALPPEQVTTDLDAVFKHVRGLPACNQKVAVAGFCWGGGQSFRYATSQKQLAAALVFYGPSPEAADLKRIMCPVYGFYGGNDARIDAGIPATEKAMKELDKTYEPVIYKGAGHGFMRAGEDENPDPANREGRAAAWERVVGILGKL